MVVTDMDGKVMLREAAKDGDPCGPHEAPWRATQSGAASGQLAESEVNAKESASSAPSAAGSLVPSTMIVPTPVCDAGRIGSSGTCAVGSPRSASQML